MIVSWLCQIIFLTEVQREQGFLVKTFLLSYERYLEIKGCPCLFLKKYQYGYLLISIRYIIFVMTLKGFSHRHFIK